MYVNQTILMLSLSGLILAMPVNTVSADSPVGTFLLARMGKPCDAAISLLAYSWA